MAEPGQAGAVRPFEGPGEAPVRMVDPNPVTCEGALHLWFSRLRRGPPNGQPPSPSEGLWHAAALPEGLPLTDTATGRRFKVEHGVDFIVAPPGADGRSANQVGPEGGADRLFIDPDPVRLPDGRWFVYTGSLDRGGFYRFEGTDAEACPAWRAAWGS
jgi:hypothetical protein